MALINKLSELTHKILPLQQMFHSYEKLANNSFFHFSPHIFKKCAMKCQELIELTREIAEETKNGQETKNDKETNNNKEVKHG